MGIIRELDYNTVVKIAAGEVIDRPASVVRELMDNAIDAGAGIISIHVSDGGKGYIEVRDDGKGMDKDDLSVCTKNHTTSKISTFDDIGVLSTLGFRGEALSSIAEVSELTILSRKEGELSGNILDVKDGKFISLKETGINTGTQVIVKNLFGNIPARKKFLSSPSSEIKLIDKEIIKKALAFPGISFEMVNEGKRKYISPARSTFLEKISDFYPDCLEYLVPVEMMGEGISFSGFISKPAFVRPNRLYESLFVNHRAVEWKQFYFAVNNAFSSLLPKGYFPAIFIYMDIDPHKMDVNVHPMKKEVRFENEGRVAKLLEQAIHNALVGDVGVAESDEGIVGFTPFEKKVGEAISSFMLNKDGRKQIGLEPSFTHSVSGGYSGHETSGKLFINEKKSLQDYRFVGILFCTYIIMEGDEEIVLLDQHAVHERINYEKLKDKYQNKLLAPQELLVPVSMDVPVTIVEELIENLPVLKAMGFEVEHFGGNSFIIRSSPAYIDYNSVSDTVMGFVEAIEENTKAHPVDFLDRALKQMACKASIRSGENINKEEVLSLIKEWEKTPNYFTCPHGRPVTFTLTKKELEKQFKRLGFE